MTALIQALHDPRCYPHPVKAVRLIETHISWLLLTGAHAYKIKKPVDLGFADFHTLAQRHHCCNEEVRLNRRFAPDVYLGVVPIVGPEASPRIAGDGPAIEYAVQMREFDQSALLLARLRDGSLTAAQIDALADACAAFHAKAASAPASGPFGAPAALLDDALANFDAIERLIGDDAAQPRIAALRRWTIDAHARLEPVFSARKADRRIRECHGDLHLGNIVLLDGRITPFDCIEFNPGFRWIDVMSELAFTVMDLASHGRFDFARRLLNRYLESSGDYAGLDVLSFYLVYRAMVRAKVDCIHACQSEVSEEARERERSDFLDRLALAERFARQRRPFLAITCGVSGSGKTHFSQLGLERTGAVRLRSDVERKRLSGLAANARSDSQLDGGIYAERMNDATFGRLAALAGAAVDAGHAVIVDATFIRRSRRRDFAELAAARRIPFVILHCRAADHIVARRIERRRGDASEADLDVLRHQQRAAEHLTTDEQTVTIDVDTADPTSVAAALERLSRLAGDA